MSTLLFDKTPEHRSRELMNLVAWAGRCAELPDVAEDERLTWRAEAQRAWAELQDVTRARPSAGTPSKASGTAGLALPAAAAG